jgi:hypothetical protein
MLPVMDCENGELGDDISDSVLGLLTLREELKLRVSENRVLRIIFGLRRDKVTGEWRKLHNEERNDPYLGDNIEKNEMGRACGAYG